MSSLDYKPYKKGDPLTPLQERWIDEYIKTNDLTTATINAGYKCKHPRSMGYQNSLKFKELLEERREELSKQIKKDTIAELEDIYTFWTDTLKDEDSKMTDRLKASELLAKSKGAFIEKREVKVVDTDWFV